MSNSKTCFFSRNKTTLSLLGLALIFTASAGVFYYQKANEAKKLSELVKLLGMQSELLFSTPSAIRRVIPGIVLATGGGSTAMFDCFEAKGKNCQSEFNGKEFDFADPILNKLQKFTLLGQPCQASQPCVVERRAFFKALCTSDTQCERVGVRVIVSTLAGAEEHKEVIKSFDARTALASADMLSTKTGTRKGIRFTIQNPTRPKALAR